MERERLHRDEESPRRPGADPAGGGSPPARDFQRESSEIDEQLNQSIAEIAQRYHATDVANRGGQ